MRAICDNGLVLAFCVAAVFVARGFVMRLTVVFLATVLRAADFFAALGFFLEGDLVAVFWSLSIASIRAPGCPGSNKTDSSR